MNYYISDLHLLHENVLRFDNRPFDSIEQMQETIDTEAEETKGCVTLYHDDEAIIDEMLKSAIEDACINLDLDYGDEGMSVQ